MPLRPADLLIVPLAPQPQTILLVQIGLETGADGLVFCKVQSGQSENLDALFILNGKDMLALVCTKPVPLADMLPLPLWMELPHLFDEQALHYCVDPPEGVVGVCDSVIVAPAGQPAVETLDQSLL